MYPLEQAHYFAWADRLERALSLAYPGTVWLVADFDDVVLPPTEPDELRQFCVVALTFDGSQVVTATVPFTRVVNEEAFPLLVPLLGRILERRLRAMVRKSR